MPNSLEETKVPISLISVYILRLYQFYFLYALKTLCVCENDTWKRMVTVLLSKYSHNVHVPKDFSGTSLNGTPWEPVWFWLG